MEARPSNFNTQRPSNPFQRGLGQQICQTSTAQQQEEEDSSQNGNAIQELVRKIQNMSSEDQKIVLDMFEEGEPQDF